MNALEETQHLLISSGSWELDVEPIEEMEHHSAESQVTRPEEPTTGSTSVESTTPPPLRHILEAMLFAATEPLSVKHLCSLIRNLSKSQLCDTVRQMNQHYRRQGRPFEIVTQPTGYRMMLRGPFRYHLEALYGSIKEARFSQLAIETLAIIAYRQPVTQIQTENILGQDPGLPLRQLIRRGMIHIQGQDENQQPCYMTSPRFLEYFGLSRIEDLPRADDLERL